MFNILNKGLAARSVSRVLCVHNLELLFNMLNTIRFAAAAQR